MLLIWDAIEADFLRDYGIDLREQIRSISWRRFLVLLNNLSPTGAVAVSIRAEAEKQEKEGAEGKEAADAFFSSVIAIQ